MKTSLFLLGSIIILGFAQSALAITSDISLTGPSMVDSSGRKISEFHVGTQIGVESLVKNHGTSQQKFSYVVQVLDSNGGTDSINMLSSGIGPNQNFTVAQSFIPTAAGQYTIQVFVWDSLISAIPLTDVLSTQITVS